MRYGGKACSFQKSRKMEYKNSPICSFCELYNFGGLGCVMVSVMLVVKIGGVYGVTIR